MPRAKKAAPVAPESDSEAPALAASAFELVPLARLRRAPENVRHTNQAVDIESLADDIAAHGLLQNLIGYAGDTSIDKAVVYIVGGGRRLQALQRLLDLGALAEDFPVPVLLRSPAEAIDLSLSENLAKRDMNPADEFLAFEALMKPGLLSPADLAKKFGFSERYVKQRLRLAALAPEILDALREGKLTIDAAMAYAGSQNHRLQMKVFATEAKKGAHAHHAMNIRFGISGAQMRTGDALFKFVGARDYEAKGGRYEDDLFADAESLDGRKLRDPDIIQAIASDRVHFQQARVLADAKEAHPTTSDVLVCPGLRLDRWPKAPKGYELVDKGYRHDLGSYEALRDKAGALGIDIVGICGVDHGGRLALGNRFFVPGARLADIIPPISHAPRETPEELEAKRRANAVRSVAAFLAAKKVRDDKVEGRQFWRTTRPDLWRSSDVEGVGECYAVGVDVLVTPDDIEAQLEAAAVEYDRQEAEKAAEREAKQRAEEEAAAAEASKRADLAAMDPVPAVLQMGELLLFRWADGCWYDEREVEGADPVYQFDDLAEVLEWAEAEGSGVRGAWVSLESYEAAHVPEVDAEDQVDQAA
mgnify:CR=1 FL=1